MTEEEAYIKFYDKAKNLLGKHITWDEMHESLVKDGAEELMTAEIIKQIKLIHYAQKRKTGLNFIGVGASLLLISFLYVCANFFTQTNFSYVMYGLTTAGLLLMFYGLYEMIG